MIDEADAVLVLHTGADVPERQATGAPRYCGGEAGLRTQGEVDDDDDDDDDDKGGRCLMVLLVAMMTMITTSCLTTTIRHPTRSNV
jgi:hypothetical protein